MSAGSPPIRQGTTTAKAGRRSAPTAGVATARNVLLSSDFNWRRRHFGSYAWAMAALKAFLLRWTSRALKFCIPEALWGDRLYSRIHFLYTHGRLARSHSPKSFNDHIFRLRLGRLFADPTLSVEDALGDLA